MADVVAGWTKIPVKKLAEEESELLKNLENILHESCGPGGYYSCIQGDPQRPHQIKKDPKRPIDPCS